MTAQIPPFGSQYQQQQQTMTGRPMDERITSLEVRVGGIEDGIKYIVAKLDTKGQVNYMPIIGGCSLLITLIIAVGSLAFKPLSDGIGDVKSAIVKFESRADRFIPREDIESRFESTMKNLDDRFKVGTERRNDLQARTDDRVARIERDVEALQKAVVPRGELTEVWSTQRVKDEALQRQVDELRKSLTDLNSPRDTIQAIMGRLKELEAELRKR